MPEDFFSVSELNQLIKDVITVGFPRTLWVCGELQNYDRNKDKKHVFFELVEKDEVTHEIKARTGLVIWAGVRPKIEAILKRGENAFELKDDIEVKFLCKVDFYSPHGAIRLVVENIDPVYTLGKVAQERQRLIAELTKSGVLQKNKALNLPLVPLSIGLITAVDSAAYNDFCDELKKSKYAFKIFFVRTVMQGKNCAESVCGALKVLNRLEGLDVIVITRGGGSIAELSSFDSKPIAEAVAASRYPVLTGIGHEINTSVTDLAAHTFAKTPTAVAQFLTSKVTFFIDVMAENYLRAINLTREKLRDEQSRLKNDAFELQNGTRALLKDRRESFVRLTETIKRVPLQTLLGLTTSLLHDQDALKRIIHLRIHNAQIKIGHHQKIIDFASPKKILRRGFSITRTKTGELVRDAISLNDGDGLLTEVANGRILSVVQKVHKEDERA